MAIAGMVLGYAVVGMLKQVSVLDRDAIDNTFEAALASVENSLSPDDAAAALARQLLDFMGGQLASHVPPIKAALDQGEPRMNAGWIAKSELARR